MRIYCTSKNTGPSYHSDPIHMIYIGTSLDEAVEAVGTFTRYESVKSDFPREFADAYTALPRSTSFEFVRFYSADGWWYSVVKFELN